LAAKLYLSHEFLYTPLLTATCWQKLDVKEQPSTYPPTTMLLFLPTTLISTSAFTFLWDLSAPLIFLLTLCCFTHLIRFYRPWLVTLLFALSTTWIGLLYSFSKRNINLLLLVLIFLAFTYLRRHPKISGSLIGIAALLKIWPVILLFPGLLHSRWRSFFTSGLFTILLGILISVVLFKPAAFIYYQTDILPLEIRFVRDNSNLSLTSLITKILQGVNQPSYPPPSVLTGTLIKYFIYISFIIQAFMFARFLISSRFRLSVNFPLYYAVLIIPLYIVFFPLSWEHGQFLLLLPLAVFIRDLRRHKFSLSQKEFAFMAAGFLPLWLPYTPEIFTKGFLLFPITPISSSILYISLTIFASLPLLINLVLTDKFSQG
jgi:hypothetical protein